MATSRSTEIAGLPPGVVRTNRTTHGYASGSNKTPEYRIWSAIKKRCLRETDPAYSDYGGRGITIHPAWANDFAAFLAYVGPRPSKKHSIDRYPDNDGNYEPGNVRWATQKEQCRNTRANRKLTINGETKCIAEWAEVCGLTPAMIGRRLSRGWSAADAVKTAARFRHTQLTVDGETRTVRAWSDIYGVSVTTIHWRLSQGWPADLAVKTPARRVTARHR